MIRHVIFIACIAGIMAGCMSLPGSDTEPVQRFQLQANTEQACTTGDRVLKIGIVQVGAGLDNDRVARIDAASGEVTYLKGVRWISSSGKLVEQALASSLECVGYSVQTGHQTRLGSDRLQCEIRSLNLVHEGSLDHAEFGLSCWYKQSSQGQRAIIVQSSIPVQRWSVSQAMGSFQKAYAEASSALAEELKASAE